MIRIKYNGDLFILDNLKRVRHSNSSSRIDLDEYFIMFDDINVAKSVFDKICMTEKDLDIDMILKEDEKLLTKVKDKSYAK